MLHVVIARSRRGGLFLDPYTVGSVAVFTVLLYCESELSILRYNTTQYLVGLYLTDARRHGTLLFPAERDSVDTPVGFVVFLRVAKGV